MDIAYLFESVEQQLEVTGKFERESNSLTSSVTGNIKTVNNEQSYGSSTRRKNNVLVKKVSNRSNPLNGSTFSGIVDMMTGQPVHGRLEYESDEIYEGPFLHGLRYGENAMALHLPYYGKGSKFLGTYCNDMPIHGLLVTETFTYRGTLLSVKKNPQNKQKCDEYHFNGSGVLLKSNGHIYEGEFSKGKFHGVGKEIEKDGMNVYKGSFKNGERHGIGTYNTSSDKINGTTYCYSGVWSCGAKEGEGTETLPSNDIYTGQFHNNNRHGFGTLTKWPSDKTKITVLEGKWRAGMSVSGGGWIITYPNGNKFMGEVDQIPKPHGNGMMIYMSGQEVYTGEFQNGVRHGEGLHIYLNGDKYEGIWVDDKPVGSNQQACDTNEKTSQEEKKEADASLKAGGITPGSSNDTSKNNDSETDISDFLSSSVLPDKNNDSAVTPNNNKNVGESSSDENLPQDTNVPRNSIFYYPNGDSYTGVTDDLGQRQGHGRYTEQRTGSTYDGEFLNNMRHGKGVLITATAKYSGDFHNDAREGEGTLICEDSSTYSGQFSNGDFHGVGTFCESDGKIYVGDWTNGSKHGEGTETYADGTVFMGGYQHGERHGFGTLVEHQGGKVLYSGDWSHDEMDGQGVRVWRDADNSNTIDKNSCSLYQKYEGGFKNGQPSGHGVLTTRHGMIVEGEWQRGTSLAGQWRITYKDGSFFYGEAYSPRNNNGKAPLDSALPIPHGFGKMKYKNGDEFTGYFVEGKRQGKGTCAFGNGDTWNGDWSNDSIDMNGNGELTMGDGTVHKFTSQDSS